MSLSQTLQVFEAFDSGHASGRTVVDMFARYPATAVTVSRIDGAQRLDRLRQDRRARAAAGGSPKAARRRWAWSAGWAASAPGQPGSAWCPTATAPSRRSPPR